MLWNVIIEASDVLYTDALEYYAGVHKVIDETFKDTAHFKESEQGEIREWGVESSNSQLCQNNPILSKNPKKQQISLFFNLNIL